MRALRPNLITVVLGREVAITLVLPTTIGRRERERPERLAVRPFTTMRSFSPHLSEQPARRARPLDNRVRSLRRGATDRESTGAERSSITAGAGTGLGVGAGAGAGSASSGGASRCGSGEEDSAEGTGGGAKGRGVPAEAAASWSERSAFRRPPVAVFPANALLESVPPSRADFTPATLAPGSWDQMRAATPAVCGVAIEVPLKYE